MIIIIFMMLPKNSCFVSVTMLFAYLCVVLVAESYKLQKCGVFVNCAWLKILTNYKCKEACLRRKSNIIMMGYAVALLYLKH